MGITRFCLSEMNGHNEECSAGLDVERKAFDVVMEKDDGR